ncbi:LytTR family DNA-binding domain-containing protein [Ruminococcaceae bacterium OttesenSCG-928-D13]|nr:LytTR family DNA-binding domain-containing protein [Ruminococcaceae bacterium OttesenSCG-928-D13]
MRIAIVDDMPQEREAMAAQAMAACDAIGVPCDVVSFNSGDALLRKYAPGRYDAVLLDIFMDGTDGMETARKLREADRQVKLVFVTVSDDHAVQGFEVQATHYLVKPATPQQMECALRACLSRQNLDERFITVKSGHQQLQVLFRNIIRTSKGRNYVTLHTTRGDVRVYVSFLQFAPQLLADARFVQCSYGILLNMEYVSRLDSRGFVLDDGQVAYVPRRERERIRAAWVSYEAEMQKERWA